MFSDVRFFYYDVIFVIYKVDTLSRINIRETLLLGKKLENSFHILAKEPKWWSHIQSLWMKFDPRREHGHDLVSLNLLFFKKSVFFAVSSSTMFHACRFLKPAGQRTKVDGVTSSPRVICVYKFICNLSFDASIYKLMHMSL